MTRAPLIADRIRHHARTNPDALAVRAPGGERTMGELAARAERFAARLRAEGCRPGDRLVATGRPSLSWFEVMIGAMFARCAFAPLSTSLTARERKALLADACPELVFADGEVVQQTGFPEDRTIVLEELEGWLGAGSQSGEPDIPEGGDIFSIIYSSGTTGVPKGIAHSARTRAEFIHARPRPGFGPGRLGWVSTSLCTNFSFLGMITPLYWGAAVSIAPNFSVEGFFAACEREQITDLALVPVQVKRIVEHNDFDPARIGSVLFTQISGSPIDVALKCRLAEQWPGRVVDAYGTTETGGIATLDLKATPDKLDTVGRIMDSVEPVLLDENGEPVAPGEIGEIAAITANTMLGYFNRDDLTDRAVWRDDRGRRFIRTGDVGYIDADNFLHITGRAKDMIISGGHNVFAIDIEEALVAHAAVAEAAVIAVPDERWGETPLAIVALRPGKETDRGELMAWLRERIDRTHLPSNIEFVPELPRNEMGKVLKRVLRDPYWSNRDRDVA